MLGRRPRRLKWIVSIVLVGLVAYPIYFAKVVNPRVINEIKTDPGGDRAQRVMLLRLADNKALPVNYWRQGDVVYAGADFLWWKSLRGDGAAVSVLIQGETLRGHARAVTDDAAYRDRIFADLRPSAPAWLPQWAKGVLVEIKLDPL